jgi:hypothetical protein
MPAAVRAGRPGPDARRRIGPLTAACVRLAVIGVIGAGIPPALSPPRATAATTYQACVLLRDAEVEPFLEAKIDATREYDIALKDPPWVGEKVTACDRTAGRSESKVGVVRAPAGITQWLAVLALASKIENEFESEGWAVTRQKIDQAQCMTLQSPSRPEGVARYAGCGVRAGARLVLVTVGGVGLRPDIRRVKALADTAAARAR